VFKLCTKVERNRIIHGWVIDDLARLHCATLAGWTFLPNGSLGRGPNFTQLGEDIGRSFVCKKFASECGYLVAFLNMGGSRLSDVENDAKFRTFWPRVKIRKGWARPLCQLLKLYLRPNLRNTFDGHPLRGWYSRWIDKKEKKVHQ